MSNTQIIPLSSTELSHLTVDNSPAVSKTAMEVLKSPNPNFQTLLRRPDCEKVKEHLFTVVYVEMKMIWPSESQELLTTLATSFCLYIEGDKPDWKINDIYLFFKFLLRNQINNKQYRKPDMSYIGGIIADYEGHKADARVQLINEQKENKSEQAAFLQERIHPKYIEALKTMLEITNPNKKPVPRLLSEADRLVNRWVDQFNRIKKLQDRTTFIRRFGGWMDMQMWLEHKQDQYKRIVDNQPK